MDLRPKLVASALSEAQARAILRTVRFPGFDDDQKAEGAALPAPTLATLSLLQMHFLLTFPFESLAMNYEPDGKMAATLEHTYARFIERRHGGGYCLQVNLLYRELLALLGFRFIGVLGRVYSAPSKSWSGLTHTASLVYLPSHLEADGGKRVYYHSDVGFGSSPHRPILLRDGWEEFGRGKDKFRLLKSRLQPRSSLEPTEGDAPIDDEVSAIASSQCVWRLQTRKHAKPDWEDCYSFAPTECFEPDYTASNHATSHAAAVPFASMILVVRYVLDATRLAASQDRIARDGLHPDLYPYHPACVEQRMIVGDKHIVKTADDSSSSTTLSSERQRVELLKSDFGLLAHVETRDALDCIRTKPSALTPPQPQ